MAALMGESARERPLDGSLAGLACAAWYSACLAWEHLPSVVLCLLCCEEMLEECSQLSLDCWCYLYCCFLQQLHTEVLSTLGESVPLFTCLFLAEGLGRGL